MKSKILIVIIGLCVVLGVGYVSFNKKTATLGNIQTGGGDYATSTDQFGSLSIGSTKVLKTGQGVLTGIMITNETAGSFNLYDATSTNHGDHATTTLIKVYANLAEGDYIVPNGIAFTRGLLFETQSTNIASATIMWR